MTIQAVRPAAPDGLADGGHVHVACSNCQAGLLDIWRTRPHEKDVWKVRANCPFCGNASYEYEIRGGFHSGGFGVVRPEDEDETIASTVIINIRTVDDTFFFETMKARPDALPVKIR